MTRADLNKQPAEVAAMFDALAGRYDLMNDILSMGQVRLWRKRVQRILQASPGDRVLDLAAGTGTSSVSFAAAGADVVACDFSLGMLKAGQARQAKADPYGTKTRGRVAFAGRRRAPAAVQGRRLRRGDDLVRAAERARDQGRARRDAPGNQARRATGGVRVQ